MTNFSDEWSRRKFLASASVAGAAIFLNPKMAWASNNQYDPRIAAIVARTMGIDMHNHVDVPLGKAELPGPNIDLSAEMMKSGLSAICMTFAVDYQKLSNPGDAYDRFLNGLSAMDEVLKANKMYRALNLVDLNSAYERKRPTVIQSIEGAHFLEGKLDRLDVAYNRGLRHLGLLHDSDASTPLGDVFTNPEKYGGLTAFGAEVVKKCNELGILIDLSHGTNGMVNAAITLSKTPVLVSHTGLDTKLGSNADFAKMMRPRLISAAQAKIVTDSGGVIGVWTHLSDSPLEYAQNIRAMVDVAGIDHVGIGTDTKLTPSYRSPNADSFGRKPGENGPPPGGDQIKRPDVPPRDDKPKDQGKPQNNRVGERTNESWKDQTNGFYYAVVEAMLATGFSEDEIGKIGGGNFCRIFDAATSGHK